MNLLIAYLGCLLVTQAAAVGLGLVVDKLVSPYAGLIVFLIFYFTMFWVAWQIAVRLTAPKSVQEAQPPAA
jgi:hypothetical protein